MKCPKKCRKIGRSFQFSWLRWTKAAISYSRKAFKWTKGNHKTDEVPINGLMGWPWNPSKLVGFSPGEKVVVIYRPIFVWKDFFVAFFFRVKRIPAQTIKRHLTLISSLVTSFPDCFRMPRCLSFVIRCNWHSEPRTWKQKNSPKCAMVLESSATSARWASD